MPLNHDTAELCLDLLRQKAEKLSLAGENRFPRRSDFSDQEVAAIKAHFGPWPRALEAAGIKEKRSDDRKELNREKRIRAKQKRRQLLKNKQAENKS